MTDCFKCLKRNERKAYTVHWGNVMFHFDVQKALELAAKYQPVPCERWMLEKGLEINDHDPAHLDHVDMTVPILFGAMPLDYLPESQRTPEVEFVAVFLDGSHRAARALRDNITVNYVLLSKIETMSCMMGMIIGDSETLTQLAGCTDEKEREAMEANLKRQGLWDAKKP